MNPLTELELSTSREVISDSFLVNRLLDEIVKYFVPEKLAEIPSLRTMTVVGYMESGKTMFVKALFGRIEQFAIERGFKPIFVVSKSFLNALEWFKHERPDANYITIFVDDVLRDVISWERNKHATNIYKEFSTVRHFFHSLGYRNTVLSIVFAGQRWTLIPPFLRNAPIVVMKSLPSHDKRELLEVARNFGKGVVKVLKELTYRIYVEQDPDAIFTAVVKPMWESYSFLVTLREPRVFPKNVIEVENEVGESSDLGVGLSISVDTLMEIARKDPEAVILKDGYAIVTRKALDYISEPITLKELAARLGGEYKTLRIGGISRRVAVIPLPT